MTAGVPLEILGIRHHGPGSARSVGRALDALDPEVVVIEGPPELDAIAALAGHASMRPPVAALVYVPDDPRRAVFYPMAVFSPEWVALRWALAKGRLVRFADLPSANRLALDAEGPPATAGLPVEGEEHSDSSGLDGPTVQEYPDAIGALAAAAGYDDHERWWEDAVEQRLAGADPLHRFTAVGQAVAEFRAGVDDPDLTLVREAAMRKVLRSIVRDAAGPVAVICGAYHAPALQRPSWPSATADNAVLKGLPKVKVAATWSPWTSSRLAYGSGYGAGVDSPGWYHHLFTQPDDAVGSWMVRVARCLRRHDFEASSASVVEATRLAGALAAMRGRPLAGLSEVNDAALSVLTGGSPVPMKFVAGELIVGRELGEVPEETPQVPLARDLARLQSKLRMKPSAESKTVVLDLRKESQLQRSLLMHRLNLLGIPWGVPTDAGRTTGTFKEAWTLQWQPEFAVSVIEASVFGGTVEAAAAAQVLVIAGDDHVELRRLTELVEACLEAELPDALIGVLDRLEERTAATSDTVALAEAVEPLARTERYGNVRGLDTGVIGPVLRVLVTRVAVGLTGMSVQIDDEAAARVRTAIEGVERGVRLVQHPELTEVWDEAIDRLAEHETAAGGVAGRVNRMVLDGGRIDTDEAGRRLGRVLSTAGNIERAAAWLDGFLSGEAVILIHDAPLLDLIDGWLTELPSAMFDDVLPLIRRTFGRFDWPERRMIGQRVRRAGGARTARFDCGVDVDRAAPAVDKVADLLGLEDSTDRSKDAVTLEEVARG